MHNNITEAQAGDPAAFTALAQRYGEAVWWIAMSTLEDAAEAHDATQDAFLRAWLRLPDLRSVERFEPWLYQIARNAARDLRRRRATRHRTAEATRDLPTSSVPSPQLILEQSELRDQLSQSLDGLPAEQREIIVLRDGGQHSTQEIADLLGISEAAVRKRLSRARQRMREDLSDEWSDRLAVARAATLAGLVAMAWPDRAKASGLNDGTSPSSRWGLRLGLTSALVVGMVASGLATGWMLPVTQDADTPVTLVTPVTPRSPSGSGQVANVAAPGESGSLEDGAQESAVRTWPPHLEVRFLKAKLDGLLPAACPMPVSGLPARHQNNTLNLQDVYGEHSPKQGSMLYLTLDETLDGGPLEGVVAFGEGRQLHLTLRPRPDGVADCEVRIQANDWVAPAPSTPPPLGGVLRGSVDRTIEELEAEGYEVVEVKVQTDSFHDELADLDNGIHDYTEVLNHPDLSAQGRRWALRLVENRREILNQLIDEADDLNREDP